jgi:hypothetical protein
MSSPETVAQSQLIKTARQHADELVRAFTARGREPVSATCGRAAAMVDRYCGDLLDLMVTTLPPSTQADAAWLRSQYLTLIVEFGSAIRDAIVDSETRHAAAQGIQCRVLDHERHLKPALDAILANVPVADVTPKPAESPPPAQESYLARPDITRV